MTTLSHIGYILGRYFYLQIVERPYYYSYNPDQKVIWMSQITEFLSHSLMVSGQQADINSFGR